MFISQPQDMIVTEGSDVRFQCSFEGSVRIPDWKINMTLYYYQYIPYPFTFRLSDFSLTVQNVDVSLNGTPVQCVVPGMAASSVGHLIVLRRQMLHASTYPMHVLIKLTTTSHSFKRVHTGMLHSIQKDN